MVLETTPRRVGFQKTYCHLCQTRSEEDQVVRILMSYDCYRSVTTWGTMSLGLLITALICWSAH